MPEVQYDAWVLTAICCTVALCCRGRNEYLLHVEVGKASSLHDAIEQDGLQLRVSERPAGAVVEAELRKHRLQLSPVRLTMVE